MCGIIGYTGHRPAIPLIMEALRRMEYRGYDSSGVGYVQGDKLCVLKAEGKLVNLEEKLSKYPTMLAASGIGHIRWATHGVPIERNAHPHMSNDSSLIMVHNGIIENYQEIKNKLLDQGFVFYSETDTEVLLNLIQYEWQKGQDLLSAFAHALRKARGAYAVSLISLEEPSTILAARVAAPLIIGVGTGEMFVASDVTGFLPYTRDLVFLEEGEVAKLSPDKFDVFDLENLSTVEKKLHTINWDIQSAQKGGYKHFMLKEIFEQPKVLNDCFTGRIEFDINGKANGVLLPELDSLPIPERFHIVACGTSFHAGMWARNLFENWAQIPVSLDISSEFRYREPVISPDDILLAISQSGETADTLAALRLAKEKGCLVIGLCNVLGSSIARESDAVIYTQAGPEISVASTKAMCSQMALLFLMSLYYAQRRLRSVENSTVPYSAKKISADFVSKALNAFRQLPDRLKTILPDLHERAKEISRQYASANSFFYLGRGACYPLALEGALKLKELSYIHAEGYAAGEMKHGPIALIDPDFPTFALALDDGLFGKIRSNIAEVQARQGRVIALVNPGCDISVDHRWEIPTAWGPLGGFFALTAVQLFSYEMADYLGKDVDQPRNLAKSVTVE